MALLASHGGYLVSDLPEYSSPNPLQFYPAEIPGGKDNYSDDNGINAIRRLTLVFLGHMHRVELIAKFGSGKFFFSSFPTNTLTLSYLHFFCIPEKDPFLGQIWFHPVKIISSPPVGALGTQPWSSLLSASLTLITIACTIKYLSDTPVSLNLFSWSVCCPPLRRPCKMRTTGTVSKFHHINKQMGYGVDWTWYCVTVTVWKMCCFLVSSGQLHHSTEVCFPNAPQPQHSPRDHSKPNVVLSRAWCKQTQLPTNSKIQSSLKSRKIPATFAVMSVPWLPFPNNHVHHWHISNTFADNSSTKFYSWKVWGIEPFSSLWW